VGRFAIVRVLKVAKHAWFFRLVNNAITLVPERNGTTRRQVTQWQNFRAQKGRVASTGRGRQ